MPDGSPPEANRRGLSPSGCYTDELAEVIGASRFPLPRRSEELESDVVWVAERQSRTI
jgi:hypothetical protein